MTTTLKLHLVRFSPCCRVVWMYLIQNDIPFELQDVDVFCNKDSENDASFILTDNNRRSLPILEDDKDCVVGVVKCLRYLETKYTTSRKGWSDDPQIKSDIYYLLEWAASELHGVIGFQLVYPQYLAGVNPTEEAIAVATRKVVGILEWTERKYFSHNEKFFCGHELTVADLYIGSILMQLEWAECMEIRLWPKLHAWLQEICRQEHWDTVHAKHKELVEAVKKVPFEET